MVFGAAFLLLGSRFQYRAAGGGNFTAMGWTLFTLVVALTGAGFWWFQQQFAALGYTDF